MFNYDQEMEDEYGGQFGDPRRCPVHPHFVTSSADGMFDAPCAACEGEMEEAAHADDVTCGVDLSGLELAVLVNPSVPPWTDADEIPF